MREWSFCEAVNSSVKHSGNPLLVVTCYCRPLPSPLQNSKAFLKVERIYENPCAFD